jgi:glycosyltransferase involved in cell wall biosynthesis
MMPIEERQKDKGALMRVVMVGDFPRRMDEIGGGVEAVTTYLANALQALPDIELEALTLDRWGGPARSEMHGSLPVHFVPMSTLPSRLSNWQNVRRLCAAIKSRSPDLVHAHIANQYARAASQSGIPWVLTAHGVRHLEMGLRPGILNRFRQWTTTREEFRQMRAASNLISISPFINEVFEGYIDGNAVLIDNPVDEAFFRIEPRPEAGRILYVGRLIPRKDVLTLLKAFAKVRERFPLAQLRLAGEGISGLEPTGYPAVLKRFIEDAGLSSSVVFLGQLKDQELRVEYAQCAVMAVSSILETAPMVILQAMAASVPVVSTDAGGVRHLIEHGTSGAVVPVGNAERLADELLRILSNRTLAAGMAARAKAIAETRFRAADVALKTRAVYRTALGLGSAGTSN